MSLQLLDLGQLHDGLANVSETLGRQVGRGNVLDVRTQVDARVLFCVTVGGCLKDDTLVVIHDVRRGKKNKIALTKTVVDTGRVITDTLGRPGSNKDGSGVLGHLPDGDCVLNLQDQMLGSVSVAQLHGLLDGLDNKSKRVLDGAADNVDTGKDIGLAVELVFDGEKFGFGKVNSNENDLRVYTVLGLRKKIRSDKGGVGRLVGNDEDFGGALRFSLVSACIKEP